MCRGRKSETDLRSCGHCSCWWGWDSIYQQQGRSILLRTGCTTRRLLRSHTVNRLWHTLLETNTLNSELQAFPALPLKNNDFKGLETCLVFDIHNRNPWEHTLALVTQVSGIWSELSKCVKTTGFKSFYEIIYCIFFFIIALAHKSQSIFLLHTKCFI